MILLVIAQIILLILWYAWPAMAAVPTLLIWTPTIFYVGYVVLIFLVVYVSAYLRIR